MSTELVTIEKGEPRTNTLVIAEGTETEHDSVIKLVRKYKADLDEFGPCRFEIDVVKRSQGGGAQREIAILNEPQATLIMTYMKNTPIVREFKKALVRAFFELRDIVREGAGGRRVDVNHTHFRSTAAPGGLDVRYNVDLTPVLKTLPSAERLDVLQRITGIDMQDIIERLPVASGAVTTVARFVKERISEAPGERVETQQVYSAYATYCAAMGEKPLARSAFGRELFRFCPSIVIGKSLGDKNRANCYINLRLAE